MNTYLIMDIETTGVETDSSIVEMAYRVYEGRDRAKEYSELIIPEKEITDEALDIHGISTSKAKEEGLELDEALDEFLQDLERSDYLIAHDIDYVSKVLEKEFERRDKELEELEKTPRVGTKVIGTGFCRLNREPRLTELYYHLFGDSIDMPNRAYEDMKIISECFFEMVDRDKIMKRQEIL